MAANFPDGGTNQEATEQSQRTIVTTTPPASQNAPTLVTNEDGSWSTPLFLTVSPAYASYTKSAVDPSLLLPLSRLDICKFLGANNKSINNRLYFCTKSFPPPYKLCSQEGVQPVVYASIPHKQLDTTIQKLKGYIYHQAAATGGHNLYSSGGLSDQRLKLKCSDCVARENHRSKQRKNMRKRRPNRKSSFHDCPFGFTVKWDTTGYYVTLYKQAGCSRHKYHAPSQPAIVNHNSSQLLVHRSGTVPVVTDGDAQPMDTQPDETKVTNPSTLMNKRSDQREVCPKDAADDFQQYADDDYDHNDHDDDDDDGHAERTMELEDESLQEPVPEQKRWPPLPQRRIQQPPPQLPSQASYRERLLPYIEDFLLVMEESNREDTFEDVCDYLANTVDEQIKALEGGSSTPRRKRKR